ncbi:50S ribosomal protein L22 [Candidatus Liberibacter africanus]|uniref:Large ribosomal subunit protein uL22 n=1 Tax=Candidatus Liberibacter africanus PTSAPSY TaxID=1277257 RepID=A0A0G3I3I6_LIBAF|nr:50S ribosomal protein L22 [Candidatus Liberibacter africanus]AKK19825.1 50S ribosomal protein L22 [Candidatus Liberibacter africanus PTSAPSY]QTP63687.1 50S ribosomal protein L22 [Candidatus Liberibacter africanus]
MSSRGSVSKRRVGDNEANAIASMLRISPQKLNLVAAMIRGRKVSDALADLEFSRKRIASDVKKTLRSAVANAENNHDLDVDRLIVSEAYVGKSVSMKRFHCRGRQRIGRIVRPFSRLTVVVREVPDEGKVL